MRIFPTIHYLALILQISLAFCFSEDREAEGRTAVTGVSKGTLHQAIRHDVIVGDISLGVISVSNDPKGKLEFTGNNRIWEAGVAKKSPGFVPRGEPSFFLVENVTSGTMFALMYYLDGDGGFLYPVVKLPHNQDKNLSLYYLCGASLAVQNEEVLKIITRLQKKLITK